MVVWNYTFQGLLYSFQVSTTSNERPLVCHKRRRDVHVLFDGLFGKTLVLEADQKHQTERGFKGVCLLGTRLQLQTLLHVAGGLLCHWVPPVFV